ncbi:MAG: hypothetical protein ACHQ1D_00285 [Nitrososphaerales archaeon]
MIKWIGKIFSRPALAPAPVTSIPHAKLELCFTDSKGVKYYKFPDNMSLPLERFGKLQEYMMWMSSGITSTELDGLLDEADKALTEGLLQKKNAARIGFILSEIRDRKNMVIHTELLYNFLSVQVIRQDEQPEFYNNSIQMEKVAQFKEETKNGKTYDFFLRIGLKKLNALFNMSEAEWNRLWEESIQAQEALKQASVIIQSEKELLTTEAALTNKK